LRVVEARLVLFAIGIVVLLFIRLILIFVLLFFFVFFLLLVDLIVVSWSERGVDVFAQRNGDELVTIRINPGIIQITVNGRKRPARSVKEVLPTAVEDRVIIVIIATGHEVAFLFLGVVQSYGSMLILQIVGISNPAAVARPVELNSMEAFVI